MWYVENNGHIDNICYSYALVIPNRFIMEKYNKAMLFCVENTLIDACVSFPVIGTDNLVCSKSNSVERKYCRFYPSKRESIIDRNITVHISLYNWNWTMHTINRFCQIFLETNKQYLGFSDVRSKRNQWKLLYGSYTRSNRSHYPRKITQHFFLINYAIVIYIVFITCYSLLKVRLGSHLMKHVCRAH